MSPGVGFVGCGAISEIDLLDAKLFRDIHVVARADIDGEAAKRQAQRRDILACSNPRGANC